MTIHEIHFIKTAALFLAILLLAGLSVLTAVQFGGGPAMLFGFVAGALAYPLFEMSKAILEGVRARP